MSLQIPNYQQLGQHSRAREFVICLFLGVSNCATNYIRVDYPLTVLCFLLLQPFIGAEELEVFLWV